ncbi:putative cyclase [Streptomyces sp. Ag109_O5-1]|uniref:cyclase family protein n=1 Tax=Streptomyces sp. Ag109_O5-1 TaxID=1938851 RepID=UPI000F50B68C|nr:cyclase family protein [Streptomyces sp. Ag109_O5-1]RPE37841.1 putative cyclase [Streptomyces sp. Ag109_O5-1]
MPPTHLGPVEEELIKARTAYRNRGRWGADDVLGTLNFIDDAIRAHAASLVRRGRSFSLAQEFDGSGPQGFPHGFGGDGDPVLMPLRACTQWGGLGRVHDDGRAGNGRPCTLVGGDGESVTGMEHMREAFTGRGVLLDVGRAVGDARGELPDGFAITEEHLRVTVESQGATSGVRRGDIVLVRTGQLGRVRRLGEWGGYAAGDAPGLSFTTLGWLHRTEIAAIATDTCGLEVRPHEFAGPARSPLHRIAVADMGLPLGEMWDLEALAEDCAADGVHEFLLVAAPLPVAGASGAPVSPIAVK